MVFHKMRRAPARCAAALAVSLAFAAPLAEAAGLGRLTVQSALGQPLRAEVEVTAVSRDEAPSLAVRLASQAAFRQANLEFNSSLSALRFSLDRRGDGTFVVRISSLTPVNEPFLDLLVELNWATGRVLREYTVLLDPPALRQPTPVMPPATAAASTSAAPAVSETVTTPRPPAPAAVAPVPAAPRTQPRTPSRTPSPAVSPAGDATYTVKAGDTLGRIAAQNKPAEVSLDQMMVALFRANPNAFINDNINLIRAGRAISIPSAGDAAAIGAAEARSEVVAQSKDFAAYRSRLALAATGGAPLVEAPAPAAAGRGRVTAKVDDRAAPPKTGDQLKIAKSDATSVPGAAQKTDEAVARERALQEQQARAAELKKGIELSTKALELQSKTGAQAQRAAETKKADETPAPSAAPVVPAPAPVAVAPVPAVTPVDVQPAPVVTPAPSPEPVKAEEPPAPAPVPPVAPVEAKKAPVIAPPPQPSFLEGLLGDGTMLAAIGGIAALLAGLIGFNIYRRRRVEKKEEFQSTGDGLRANSLFGATGGQSVDTGATSTFNSSFIPAASQLDSNEVDPVAEADVYIAYGREEQAEDILKEALRLQPDRHPVRVKLLEIYSRRSDAASFNAVFEELRVRTGGLGEDWERALKLGRAMDPGNAAFAGSSVEMAARGPTTELRLNPNTKGGQPITLGGMVAPTAPSTPDIRRDVGLGIGAFSAGAGAAATQLGTGFGLDSKLADTAMQADTRMTAETKMPMDTRLSPGNTTQVGEPSTRFEATLAPDTKSKPASAGTIDPFGATAMGIDFGSLDFDLGATKLDVTSSEQRQPVTTPAGAFDSPRREASAPVAELSFPPTTPLVAPPSTVARAPTIPDVDLSLSGVVAPAGAAASGTFSSFAAPASKAVSQSALEEALSRPTLLGEVGALPDEQAPRLTSNTDQATVPLIDFDLSGSDVELAAGRRTETQVGSPLAGQMATKLDLARGYIDLGVKDGARELLEEVMREGTRDQRQSAVELLKLVEA